MEAMAKFTLIERPAPGGPPADQTFVPPNHHCLIAARNQWAINSSLSTGRWSTRTEISSARSCSMHRLMSSAIAPPQHWLANVVLVRPAPDHRAPSFLDVESDARTSEVSAD
jgi:hypothetical protein